MGTHGASVDINYGIPTSPYLQYPKKCYKHTASLVAFLSHSCKYIGDVYNHSPLSEIGDV